MSAVDWTRTERPEAPVELRRGRPLVPMQRPLWMSQRRHPRAAAQNMALLTHLAGPVDADRLARAFAAVVARSDALRTTFVEEGGAPAVVVTREPARSEAVEVPREASREWAERRAAEPLDVAVRAYDSAILLHGDGTLSWYLCLHHTVTDATSSAMVFAATAAAYAGRSLDLPSYYAWARRQEARIDPKASAATAHWRSRPAAPGIGRWYEPIRIPAPAASRMQLELDGERLMRARDLLAGPMRAITDDLAWTALLLTVAAVHLHRVARVDAFSLGVPVHNRLDPAARAVIGPVMETFPVDVTVEVGDTYRSLHHRIARALLRTLRHAVPGTAPPADYEAVVNVIPRAGLGSFGGIPTTTQWVHVGAIDASQLFRLQLTAYGDANPEMLLDVNTAAVGTSRAPRAAEHLVSILDSLLEDPDRPIAHGSLCTDEELAVLARWEVGPSTDPGPRSLVRRIRTSLHTRAHEVVLEADDRSWTGAELWDTAVAAARSLRRLGVARGVRVGIQLPRSAEAVHAILATLIAGGSYVPLDPSLPERRRSRLAARAGCRVIVSSAIEGSDGDDEPEAGDWHLPRDTDEAYLLFTSGSTGEPKGVPIDHRGLGGYVDFAARTYVRPDRPLVVALFSALGFDLTVTSLFLPLVAGGRTVVISAEGPAALAEIARRRDITWCKLTPSHLAILHRLLPADHAMATLVVGGEAFGAPLARAVLDQHPDLDVFNEYGPTEAVVGCMVYRADRALLDDRAEVPIGRPAPGVTLRVVDQAGWRVPPGAAGELLIAHDGITAGYLDQADDDGAFVMMDGMRFYRSGDLVRMADDETLVFLGRVDEQVKVGGIRLDPVEVEAALTGHPAVARAAVRMWSPSRLRIARRCTTCGLSEEVPGTTFDDVGICNVCRTYERIAPQVASWFRSVADLEHVRDDARTMRRGRYDCLHLLSGGKDSTYALHRLVDLGFVPYAFTLDNGFLSEQAKDNVRRTVAALGVDHEFATTDAMPQIFADSLRRHSNVCNGCYKTIYTLATTRAVELGAPFIVTGLSRGQLFETRLIPQQFTVDRFDPEAIDRAVLEARKVYHRLDDAPNRLLDTGVFATDDVFDQVGYVDFYRYVDVELSEMLSYLAERAPWVRPTDTGRSTNCLINAAGIHTHLSEQGFHNYAVPYAWDVRLGHKTRDEAIEELDDPPAPVEVQGMLAEVGYQPTPRRILAAWIELTPGAHTPPSPAELRTFLGDTLAAHQIPAAFVVVDALPMTSNGKLDVAALPSPRRFHRSGPELHVAPETPLERAIVAIWEQVLRTEPIGADDDFFALGGDSLAALEMIVLVEEHVGRTVDEALAFVHTTPRALASALEVRACDGDEPRRRVRFTDIPVREDGPPEPSVGEQSMLFEHQLAPRDPRYNVGRLYWVHGTVDRERLRGALQRAAARHEPLAWTFGSPRRRRAADEVVAFTNGSGRRSRTEVVDHARVLHRAPFDLERDPVVRAWVQDVEDGTTAVLLVIHHVAGDASSFDRLWDEVDEAYRGHALDDSAIGYADHARWQHERLTQDDVDHWMSVDVAEEGSPLRAVRPPRPVEPDGFVDRVATVGAWILRHGPGTTGFATAYGCLAATLRRYADTDRLAIGVTVSTRDHPATEPLIGYFLNTLPISLDCSPTDPLGEVCRRAGSTIAAHLTHRTYPFAQMVADRRAARLPGFDTSVLFSYEDVAPAALGTIEVTHQNLGSGSSVTDASFFVHIRGEEVRLGLEYRGTVLSEDRARQLLDDLDAMLRTAIDAPSTTVESVALPSIAGSFLRGDVTRNTDQQILAPILRHLSSGGAAVAVECGGRRWSWDELDERSAEIAATLRGAGVRRGTRVAVALPRSTELVAAIIGVWRAGGSYVPVDPAYPAVRRSAIVERAGARVTLAPDPSMASTDVGIMLVGTPLRDDDAADRDRAKERDAGIDRTPAGSDEAYVIFTSGSTGSPRGVPVDHARLAASNGARAQAYPHAPGRFLLLSSIAFDSSVAGFFWTLSAGGTLVLPTEDEIHDPEALLRLFHDAGCSHTLLVPSLYRALVERDRGTGGWPEHVIVAGESCPTALVQLHSARRPETRLTNEYGPTEATVWSTYHHCDPADDPVPIGTPIAGTWAAVVDTALRPLPVGVVGELVVGGEGLTDGYLDEPGATAERFVADPRGERCFRTGDLAVADGGRLLFVGRRDEQLSIGGVRVEPAEIERVLESAPGVHAAVATVVDVRPLSDLLAAATPEVLRAAMAEAATADEPAATLAAALRGHGEPDVRLVAHVEHVPGAEPDIVGLRRRVAEELPAAMRPAWYVLSERLPRTPNGKIDRNAVAAHVPEMSAAPPQVDTGTGGDASLRAAVATEFAAVLRIPRVEYDESFFDLGGDSLLALRLVDRLRRATGVDVTVATLYADPTPAGVAGLVRASDRSARQHEYLIPIQPNGTRPPLFGVHVLGRNAELYRPLAEALGSQQPVYGLGLTGAFAQADAPTDVIEIARLYADELMSVAPEGPLVLTAVSMGSTAAIELARELQARNRAVALVALFDAVGPDAGSFEPSASERVRLHWTRLRDDPRAYVVGRIAHRAQVAARELGRVELRARRALRAPIPDRLKERRFIESNVEAAATHAFGTYDGRVIVFAAHETFLPRALVEHAMGWGRVVTGAVDVVEVPGGHMSMLEPPNVQALAAALRDAIDRESGFTPS